MLGPDAGVQLENVHIEFEQQEDVQLTQDGKH